MSVLESSPCDTIYLDSLSKGIPVMRPKGAGHFIEACMVCMDSQGHSSNVKMGVKTDNTNTCFYVHWEDIVTREHYMSYGGNNQRTTELGATAIALILIREVTEFTAIQEASIGTTVDYFLTSKEIDDTYIFNNNQAYCEVRGIREEKKGNTINQAVKKKVDRLNVPEDLPTYVVVVEFSKPFSRVTRK